MTKKADEGMQGRSRSDSGGVRIQESVSQSTHRAACMQANTVSTSCGKPSAGFIINRIDYLGGSPRHHWWISQEARLGMSESSGY